MDAKIVASYQSIVARIKTNKKTILDLKYKEIATVSGKVKGSSKYFPYLEQHIAVQMEDPVESERVKKRIAELEKTIKEDQKLADKIIEIYSNIKDAELKTIFDRRVFNCMKWADITRELNQEYGDYDVRHYSNKFNNYIEKL